MSGADGCVGFSPIPPLRQQQGCSHADYRNGNEAETGSCKALHRCTLLQSCFSGFLMKTRKSWINAVRMIQRSLL
jgi:hypothetical protein